jgi:predicted lipid-binding transport protein (Tim44 family)
MASQPGGFMRTFGMAMLGGFLGSMLFSGLANAAGFGGLGGSGFGLIELLLVGGLGFFLFRRLRAATPMRGFASGGPHAAQYHETANPGDPGLSGSAPPSAASYDQIDYRSLKVMDHSFDSAQFLKSAQAIFFKVQAAWNRQDIVALRALCSAELLKTWEQELAALSARGQRNKMENIALGESEISEVWTENGEDYITVRLRANLLDYTTDIRTGAIASGSDSEPVEFEEYWTYSRPVGPNAWKVTAVQQI